MKIKLTTSGFSKLDLQKEVYKTVQASLEKKLAHVVCPIHHRRPVVTNRGSSTRPDFRITGCCQQLIDKATAALKSR